MKRLLLTGLCSWLFLLGAYAQSTTNIWDKLAQYVEQQQDQAIPQEEAQLKAYRADLEAQGNIKRTDAELLVTLRQSYWENVFLTQHREAFVDHQTTSRGNNNGNRSVAGTVNNPDLVQTCNLNIAVVVDRSGSINGAEQPNVRAGLTAFVNNQVGLGNTVTFVGMGSIGDPAPAVTSATITYNPGNPAAHLNWINALTFNGNRDSWSTGLQAAVALNPDLVLVVTDGATGVGDLAAACAAANQLNTNGGNNGNGAHIFVLGQTTGQYNGNTLLTYVTGSIDPAPVAAAAPPTAAGISTTDYIPFPNDQFVTLANWMTNIIPGASGTVDITSITNRICGTNSIVFSGTYEDCPPAAVVTSIFIEFWQNGTNTGISIPVTVNADGTWTYSTNASGLINAGLMNNVWYDVRPRINLSNGTSVLGDDLVANTGNDLLLCCPPVHELYNVPECVREGETFTLTLVIRSFVFPSQIQNIYSANPYYSYVSHSSLLTEEGLILYITFRNEECTCDGNMLVFDVLIDGCEEPVWVMTDNIPCCPEECEDVKITEWSAGDCIFYNGQPARPFTLVVASGTSILGVTVGTNNASCQVTPTNLQVTDNGNGTSTITGIMVFNDPNCTAHAEVTLIVETEEACCLITRPFSFPGGCTFPEPCLVAPPNEELLSFFTTPPTLEVSIGLPSGTPVTVIDHITGASHSLTVGSIECGPFYAISIDGRLIGSRCNGIRIPAPEGIDCSRVDGQRPVIPYYFEIRFGDCVWIISGDYCDLILEIPVRDPWHDHEEIPPRGERSGDYRDQTSTPAALGGSGSLAVFPNPIADEAVLNFDLGQLSAPAEQIAIVDTYGKVVEVIQPPLGQTRFEHPLETQLSQGIYFVMVQLADGTTRSTRLVKLQ
ncbi:MAG: T9SS type A sorting domain-containing protein [Bacteroidota bacterium]